MKDLITAETDFWAGLPLTAGTFPEVSRSVAMTYSPTRLSSSLMESTDQAVTLVDSFTGAG
jgi:hypothetical protein